MRDGWINDARHLAARPAGMLAPRAIRNLNLPFHLLPLLILIAAAPLAMAQLVTDEPHIGYIFPAGGQRGTSDEVKVGGQHLDGVSDVILSGSGVKATIVQHIKPLTQKRINEIRQKVQQARKRQNTQRNNRQPLDSIVLTMGVSQRELDAFHQHNDPRRQPNPQLAETVTLRLEFAADARVGDRELRLMTKKGLTNPIRFRVGQFVEYEEFEPNDTMASGECGSPPLTLNGQIMPGDIDRFRFRAKQGMRLVITVAAQDLIPYLADAVPGWFQATLALYDSDGKEVAYVDDYRHQPDPVLLYEVPHDGEYIVEIKDSIYRGREDFVYRITIGQQPFVTSIFPMGSRRGAKTTVALKGWNLPFDKLTVNTEGKSTGIHPIAVRTADQASNTVPFAIGSLPEMSETEPNNLDSQSQYLEPPVVINGRIDKPGDWDVYSFQCRQFARIFAEVHARRLDSPLDSVLKLTDAGGRRIAVNDDHDDKGSGLATHHADSRIAVTIPKKGIYYLHIGDTQRGGGSDYTYRLHINAQSPNFRLRVAPPSINARPGSNVQIHVFALRRDGFDDTITLRLKDPPPGFGINGAWIPEGQDDVWLTLSVPYAPTKKPVSIRLEGRAAINGEMITRVAVPCEDMMQAFINRHLVPAKDWMISVSGAARFKPNTGKRAVRGRVPVSPTPARPVRLPVGGTSIAKFPAPPSVLNQLEQIVLTLSNPPDGVTIGKLSPITGGVAVHIRCDPTAEPGLKGNLVAEAAVERTSGGKTRRTTLGILPAIPYEIVPSISQIAAE